MIKIPGTRPRSELPATGAWDLSSARLIADGANDSDYFAYRAIPIGDFDLDGRPDLAVSAHSMDVGGAQSGSIALLPIPF